MMTRKRQLDSLLLLLSFVIATIGVANSRHTNTNEHSPPSVQSPSNDLADGVDLETYLDDYYNDYLWHYVDKHEQDSQMKNKKKIKEKVETENFGNYDYMSDMAVAEPEAEGKNFKSFGEGVTAADKENLTANDFGANETYGDDGAMEIIKANRERSKRLRIKAIMEQVLNFRGESSKYNVTIPDIVQYNALREIYERNLKRIRNEESSSYTEKVRSFFPACEPPVNVDEDAWSDPHSMNLWFDVQFPTPPEDYAVMIVSAKLRLYKLPQEHMPVTTVETTSSKTKCEKIKERLTVLQNDEDKQIRVSVYWYTKSLRRHRAKKRLLDSQMISLYAPKWAEFSIRQAVRTWKDSGKNFGLVVNVEDEDGNTLPAEKYIQPMNCSKWTATVRPIPSIIMDRINQYFVDNAGNGKNETAEEESQRIYAYQVSSFPIVDLCTREVPISEIKNIALMGSATKILESRIMNLSRRGFNATDDGLGSFLKKNNLDLRDISRQTKTDKLLWKNADGKNSERVSNFQNVPIGLPIRGAPEESGQKDVSEKEEDEKGMPKIRHNRKQQEMLQRSTNSWLPNDFNATDHH